MTAELHIVDRRAGQTLCGLPRPHIEEPDPGGLVCRACVAVLLSWQKCSHYWTGHSVRLDEAVAS